MTETSRPADTEGSAAPAQTSTQTVEDEEVASTEIPVEVPNPLFQTGPVDTSGIGGLPDLRSHPVFAQHRADTLQNAIDELEGNAPKSGLVVMPENLTDEQKDAQIADMKVEQARAQAVADGVPLDEFGNPAPVEDGEDPEAGEQDNEVAPEGQSASGSGEPAAEQQSGQSGEQPTDGSGNDGPNRPV